MMMSYWFSFLFPWLLVLWLLKFLVLRGCGRSSLNWRRFLGLGLASAVVVLLPVQGIQLGRWTTGLNLQPSIPLLGLLANQIWGGAFQKELFRPDDRKAGWIFGSVAGTGLYPLALGLGNFDPYSLGCSFTVLFPVVALTTVILIWKRNRFGLLLLLSILAYDLRLLESPNFWDYLVDPLFWLISLAILTKSSLKSIRGSTAAHPGEKACLQADAR